MKVTIGYKTWDTTGWKLGEDLGERTLVCPDCECTIKLKYYDQACGTKATTFCPYCGNRRQANDRQVKEEPKDSHAEYWNSIGEWKEGEAE